MKGIKSVLFIVLMFCSQSCSSKPTALPKDILNNAKSFEFKYYKKSKQLQINQDNTYDVLIENWKKSLVNIGKKDHKSYAPQTVIRSERIKVNFLDGITVISWKKDNKPKTVWNQFSRKPTVEDLKLRAYISKK